MKLAPLDTPTSRQSAGSASATTSTVDPMTGWFDLLASEHREI
jgi:hypothetical protein